MKKLLVTLVVMMAAVTLLSGPANALGKIEKGFKFGANLNNFVGGDSDSLESDLGFVGGVFAAIPVTSKLWIQTEVLYTQKNSHSHNYYEYLDITYTEAFEFGYIEVPVLLKVKFPQMGIVEPHLYGGSFVGFNVQSKWSVSEAQILDVDVTNAKSTEHGLIFGAGFQSFSKTGVNLTIDARLTLGLTKVFEGVSDPVIWFANISDSGGTATDLKNRTFSLTAGISF